MAMERSVHASVFQALDLDVDGLVVDGERYRRSQGAKRWTYGYAWWMDAQHLPPHRC